MKRIDQTSGFSTDRFLQVASRFWALHKKNWIIGLAGGLGILFLLYLLQSGRPTGHTDKGLAVIGVGLTLYKFGGYFLTSGIFSELGKKSKASQLLTLPASTFEKFAAAWFLTYFTYSLLILGFLYIVGKILGLNPLLLSQQMSDPIINISKIYFLDALLTYTAVHSVFFLGSIYFENNNFLKTLLAIILFFIGLGIFTILIWTFYPDGSHDVVNFSLSFGSEHSPANLAIAGALFKIGVAVLFLFFSYRQLQNRQIA